MNYSKACALLDVSTDASFDEIEQSYKEKISFYSPEAYEDGDPKKEYAERMTQKINEAWEYIQNNYDSDEDEEDDVDPITEKKPAKANKPVQKASAGKPSGKNNNWAPWVIVLAIVLAAAAVIAALIFTQKKPDDNKGNNSTNNGGNNNNGNGTTEEVPVPDYDFMGNDISDFINMSEYKGLTFEIEPKIELTEEYFQKQMRLEIISYGQYNKIEEGTVKETDIVKIKYVGYMDGEKFEGGEGTAQYFTIYDGGGFIDGFAKGLIGAEVGKETDVNVTFPEDYFNEDYAGKPAVFKVTVEFIYEAKELTDELVKELSGGEMETYAEFKEEAWKLMEESINAAYETSKLNAVWDHIMANSSEKNLPEDLITSYYDYIVYYYKQVATQYMMTFETFCEKNGITLESIRQEAIKEIIYETALYNIIKAENITVTDEEYKEMLKEMADSNGVTEDTVLMYYTEEDLRDMFLLQIACEKVVEWNTFVDKAPEAAE